MTNKVKYRVDELLPVALGLCTAMGPYCTRIALAGSIRRGEQAVGDIEIVCCPADGLDAWFEDQLRLRTVAKRERAGGGLIAWGERFKALVWMGGQGNGLPVDVFMVLGDRQWGPTYLIRTGPGEANDSLVTKRGIKNSQGRYGCLPEGMAFRDGAIWKALTPGPSPSGRGEKDGRLDTPEEVDVYEALGWPYVPPPLRSYQTYQALRWEKPIRVYPPDWVRGDDYFVHGERRLMDVAVAAPVEETGPLEQGRLW